MRIKNFFFSALAVPTVGAVVAGGFLLSLQWQILTGNQRAQSATLAMSAMARTMELAAVQRGNANMAIRQAGVADDGLKKRLDDDEKATEAAMQESIERVQAMGGPLGRELSQALTGPVDKLRQLSKQAQAAAQKPMDQRDPQLVASYSDTISTNIDTFLPLMDRLEKEIQLADSDVGDMVAVAHLGMDLRVQTGLRSLKVVTQVMLGKPATFETMQAIAEMKGHVDGTWKRIRLQTDQAGNPPRLKEALDKVEKEFFPQVDALYAPLLEAARTDGQFGVDIAKVRNSNGALLKSTLAVRDAAFAEALARAQTSQSQATLTLIVTASLLTALVIAGLLVGLTFNRRVVVALLSLSASIRTLADGNNQVSVGYRDRSDEVGALAGAIEILRQKSQEAEALARENAQQHQERARQSERLTQLCSSFDGDSSVLIDHMGTAAKDAIGQSRETETMAGEVVDRATEAVGFAQAAASSVDAVAAASEELAASIREISSRVTHAAEVSNRAVSESEQANTRIAGLAEAASRIGEVVGLITDIAAQTNLLALNATIEAARAGEAGKGFAVVAGEVKNLASQTAKATEEIGTQIASIQSMTREAVSGINNVADTIRSMNEISTVIAAAVEEQGAATSEIARNVHLASDSTRGAAATVEGVAEVMGRVQGASQAMVSAMNGLEERAGHLTSGIRSFLTQVRA